MLALEVGPGSSGEEPLMPHTRNRRECGLQVDVLPGSLGLLAPSGGERLQETQTGAPSSLRGHKRAGWPWSKGGSEFDDVPHHGLCVS